MTNLFPKQNLLNQKFFFERESALRDQSSKLTEIKQRFNKILLFLSVTSSVRILRHCMEANKYTLINNSLHNRDWSTKYGLTGASAASGHLMCFVLVVAGVVDSTAVHGGGHAEGAVAAACRNRDSEM